MKKNGSTINRRSLVKAGAKVIPVLAGLGLAAIVTTPARADCFPANCKAYCAENCDESCKGDCMGDCQKACGGCDTTCTGSSK